MTPKIILKIRATLRTPTIVGTMGRFPSFRETGWKILTEARIVGSA
jgi:hypothetical protein